jgi:anaerobic ribonucleoside-triphosphate reductase activating protein
MKLYLAGVDYNCKTAGPHGSDGRTEIFTQGCLRAAHGNPCQGCFNPETWPLRSSRMWTFNTHKLALILSDMMPNNLLTIGGGEPFLQSRALTRMLKELKIYRPNLDVIIYSGYVLKQLLYDGIKGFASQWQITELLMQVDTLIDGPYIEDYNTWNPKDGYIGSSNQRVYDKSQLLKHISRRWDD